MRYRDRLQDRAVNKGHKAIALQLLRDINSGRQNALRGIKYGVNV